MPMNPTDVMTQRPRRLGAPKSPSGRMFWGAHFVVKFVMLGLLAASVWCWAIIIDKTLLFSRSRKSMDQFEEVLLVRPVARGALPDAAPTADQRHGVRLRRGHARVEALVRGLEPRLRGPARSASTRCST